MPSVLKMLQQSRCVPFTSGPTANRRAQLQPVCVHRRDLLAFLAVSSAALNPTGANAAGVACPGQRGYALQQCLRQARKAAPADAGDGAPASDKYTQPGDLVTLPSGIQYRELVAGSGREALLGSQCEISYIVYRLAAGGYYKFSAGGTPVYGWSVGYGNEGQDDLGAVYTFRLGAPDSLPAAVTAGVAGMREGGRRRILVPPRLGWVTDETGPRPPTFGGRRRLATHREEALLFEAELRRVRGDDGADASASAGSGGDLATPLSLPGGTPYRLPAPPTYYGAKAQP